MIKEFCNYTQALALKELGFEKRCLGFYADKTGEDITIYTVSQVQGSINSMSIHFNNGCSSFNFSAPLYQQAFKFFREKYGLEHYIKKSYEFKKYFYTITRDGIIIGGTDAYDIVDSYEEAESACLDKLIEIIKNDS